MIESVITVKPFRFWCQKVLPLVYDDSLSYYELLCKVVDYINGLLTDDTNVITQVNELTTFVNDYFTNLDVQQEINNKLDDMVENGQLDEVISHYVDPYIAAQNTRITNFETTVNAHLSTQDSDIDVLEARMDTFASLPSGGLSTDADAELVDIRIGADGTTYTTAGNAVRGQVSDLKTKTTQFFKVLNSINDFTLEQGAVITSNGVPYSALKTVSDTRVRTANLIPLDSTKSYVIACNFSLHQVSVIFFDNSRLSTGSTDGWQSNSVEISNTPYIAIAVRNIDNSTIVPSDVNDISILTEGEIIDIKAEINTANTSITELSENLNGIADVKEPDIGFIIGTYMYLPDSDTMALQTNPARITADLRPLELEQGDTVGITDYTTYSIAFGDNAVGGGWYDGGYNTHDITANNASIKPYVILVKRNDNENMTDADIAAISDQFHSTSDVRKVGFTKQSINDIHRHTVKRNFVHLSFDDVAYCILNLISNTFDSVWDEPFFGMLKRMHEAYGAVFSLHVWDISNITNMPATYKTELMDASQWLKFGYHATAEGSLADATYETAKTQYEAFIADVFYKIGGVNSVDRMPRLNYFAGNLNALRGLRDANCGCVGFLNTDDTRNAYYLTPAELTYLRTHSLWTDRTNGLQFMSTVMRLDWFVSGFSSQYEYNTPQYSTPYEELVYRYGQPSMADLYANLIVFTHEWQTYSSSYVLNTAMVNRIEQVCQFANAYGYDFDFPQNRVPNVSSYAIE